MYGAIDRTLDRRRPSSRTNCATSCGVACAKSAALALIASRRSLAVALATWSVQDPSLSHATNAPVRNMLGTPGAVGADLLMQLFGLCVGG